MIITYNGKSMFQHIAQHITKTTTIHEVANHVTAMREERYLKYKVINSAEVDGEPWRTVRCNKEISKWIKTQEGSWQEHIDQSWNIYANTFDISEELYLMLVLKFGQ